MPAPTFNVTLHHLSSDAKETGSDFPEHELRAIPEAKLRGLVNALATSAPRTRPGAAPELRVQGPQGRFTIQVSEGRLRFNSWSTRVGGFDLTTEQILSIITGTEDSAPVATRPPTKATMVVAADTPEDEIPEELTIPAGAKVGFLVAVILVINGISYWMMTKPPPNPFVPEYTALPADPAERLLKDVAGEYRTGSKAGSRGVTIGTDGRIVCVKFGAGGAIIETTEVTSQPVQSAGHASLLVDGKALMEFVDSTTLTLYGDTYRRKGL